MEHCFNTACYCNLSCKAYFVVPMQQYAMFYCFNIWLFMSSCNTNLHTVWGTHLPYLDVIRVLKGGGQLLPGRGHGFAVTAPWSKELNEVGTWSKWKRKRWWNNTYNKYTFSPYVLKGVQANSCVQIFDLMEQFKNLVPLQTQHSV